MKRTTQIWLPDIHFPLHDEKAMACVRKIIRQVCPDVVGQVGDMLDCGVFSAHPRKSLQESVVGSYLEDEVAPARELIDYSLEYAKKWVQLEGNHEYRVERWAMTNGDAAREAFGVISPKALLSRGYTKKQFEWIPYVPEGQAMSYYSICPDLIAVHGWSYAKHCASVHADRSKTKSILFGHAHRQQLYATRNPFTGQVVRAFSPGTLCKLQPLYVATSGGTPTDWVHGVALIYTGRGGGFSEYLITIENGKCVLPDGTKIEA